MRSKTNTRLWSSMLHCTESRPFTRSPNSHGCYPSSNFVKKYSFITNRSYLILKGGSRTSNKWFKTKKESDFHVSKYSRKNLANSKSRSKNPLTRRNSLVIFELRFLLKIPITRNKASVPWISSSRDSAVNL